MSAVLITSTRRRCWMCGFIRPTRPVPTPDACRTYPVCGTCVPVEGASTAYLVVLDDEPDEDDPRTLARIFRTGDDGPRLVLDQRLSQARRCLHELIYNLHAWSGSDAPATVTVTALTGHADPTTSPVDWS